MSKTELKNQDSTAVQTEVEKFAYPISILELDQHQELDVNVKMTVEFYAEFMTILNKFNYLNFVFLDSNIPVGQKGEMLKNAFTEQEVSAILKNIQSLLGAIAFDQTQKGVISKLTEQEFKDKMTALYQEAEKNVQPAVEAAKESLNNQGSETETEKTPLIIAP